MYALARLFSTSRQLRLGAGLLTGVAACALTASCLGDPLRAAKVDQDSPVAPEVSQTVRIDRGYPTFASIPPAPKDLRPTREYGREAQAVAAARDELEKQTAPETWSLGGTKKFAADAQAKADEDSAPDDTAPAESLASDQRMRATPPPPPER